jgi:ATP-dependent 26S proteasome regulatory subunit
LLRPGRFDHLVFVDVPDREGRKAIFEVNLKKMKVSD